MSVLHIEDDLDKNKGATYMDGAYREIVLAVVGAMHSSDVIAGLLENAVTTYKITKQKGWNPTKNVTVAVDEAAEKAYEELRQE